MLLRRAVRQAAEMGEGMKMRNLVLGGFLAWLIVGGALATAMNNQGVRRGCNPSPWWHQTSIAVGWPILVPMAALSIALGWESTGECPYGKADHE